MRRALSKRQKVAIEIALRPRALLEFNAVLGETSARPLAGVFVADNCRHAVTAQQCGELSHCLFWIERRPDFDHRVENAGGVAAEMGDRQRHRIRDAARRIDEAAVGHAGLGRQLVAAPHGHRVDRLARDDSRPDRC